MSEYERQALVFLENTGTEITIKFQHPVQGFPNDENDKLMHNKYKVTLRRDGKSYSFPFYGSHYDYQKNIHPNAYDVLAAVCSYDVEPDVWDFAKEFGYEINDKKSYNRVCNIHKECRKQYRALLDLFGPVWIEKLQEIN